MVIWSGWGILGLVVPVIGTLLFTFLADLIFGNGYVSHHGWPVGLGALVSAAVLYLISARLSRPGRTLLDPATGQVLTLQRRDTLFFIPLKYIAILVGVFGLFMLLFGGHSAANASSTASSLMIMRWTA